MVRLIVSADGAEQFESWRKAFADVAPDLNVCSWYHATVQPSQDDYVLVWKPEDDHFKNLTDVKAILCTGAGVDHLLRSPDFPQHVPLVRMGGEQTVGLMADYVTWAAIGLLRDARTWAQQQATHKWSYNGVARTCAETRIGVMGLGHLGSQVANHLARVGFQVSGWRRSDGQVAGIKVFSGKDRLTDFLKECDILVNLLPSTPETRGLVDSTFLRNLPRGAGFINVGRGDHVNQADLLQALDDGVIGGAVLDVVTPEPLPAESALWAHPRITITPHVASEASRTMQARYVADVIAQMERGERPSLLCDPEKGY
ncbi:glyoxylate/hydroxypyruvate reductase A [Acetobacter indonesiensis]|uniref:2-hydroxyacid dehydrogenase n=1 Tax=Acetobacter indonesiensis TaxID=104101 RepID=UPI001F3F5940|nr:glyoxylate/hydroxypyruvate reductase A [Acetobacter indonesiensis]MCG0995247.1 glyoxylate/hydroxypyruvate reductase A [Acetobacter indonesiensis]